MTPVTESKALADTQPLDRHDGDVRVLKGTKITELAASDFEALLNGRALTVDVGAGDGRWVYEEARRDVAGFYVAVDPDADALADYAYRAARKPARGGVENALFVVASLEQLPLEILGRAVLVRVNFPWAGLLRGLLRPDPQALEALISLAAPDASIEIVTGYDADHDRAALQGEDLPTLDAAYIESTLTPAYELAGITIERVQALSHEETLAIASTWGRRLVHGRPQRAVFLITGHLAPK